MRSLFNAAKSLLIASLLLPGTTALAPGRAAPAVKNIVLVHGAFADGSSWAKVIPLLQAKGFHVTAVGNPLTSYADDLAATRRQIAAQDGPVVLVGHSYAGVVITEAGADPRSSDSSTSRRSLPMPTNPSTTSAPTIRNHQGWPRSRRCPTGSSCCHRRASRTISPKT